MQINGKERQKRAARANLFFLLIVSIVSRFSRRLITDWPDLTSFTKQVTQHRRRWYSGKHSCLPNSWPGAIPGRRIDFCGFHFLLSCSLNGQKVAASNEWYLQVEIQLRRNAFNLDLKREKDAALCILQFSELKTFGPYNLIPKRLIYWCSKLWHGGHVGDPNKSFGSWILFLSKNFSFLP